MDSTQFIAPFRSTFIALLLAGAGSEAAIVMDGINGTTAAGVLSFKGTGGVVPYQEVGFAFHVSNTSDFQFDALNIDFNSAVTVGAPIEVSLWNAGTGTPQGTLVSLLSGPATPSAIIGTFTPVSPVTLTADTDYFVLLRVPVSSGFYRMNTTLDAFSVTDWTMGQSYLRAASSGPWTAAGSAPRVQFEATAVPEPMGAAMLACGSLALLLRRRRVAA